MTASQDTLRTDARRARASMNTAERDRASRIITERVSSAHWFQRAEYVACYLPAQHEVNTWEIISRAWQQKKRVFAPVCEKNFRMRFVEITPETEVRRNSFGIYEPDEGDEVTARMLDLVITPLVAFDENRHRVGMGGGYYDRAFSFLRHRSTWLHPKLVGVAFACQQVHQIPPNPWDIPLFAVITENSVHSR